MQNEVNTILGNLGSFWANTVGDNGTARSVLNSTISQFEQIVLDAAEAAAVISRFEIPLYKTGLWKKLEVRVSEITREQNNFLFDGTAAFNGEIVFGQAKSLSTYKVAIPDGESIKEVGGVVDRPVDPTVSLTSGVDYTISDGCIHFVEDPTTLGFSNSSIYNATTGEDEPTVIFWLYNSSEDFNRVYNHFGFVVGVYSSESSENYRNLINSIFDTLIRGSNLRSFKTAAACIFNIPIVKEPIETVVSITTDVYTLDLVITTDKHTYSLPVGATAAVAVDDVVYGGDSLINEFQVVDGERLLTFEPEGFGVELHSNQYAGPIIFDNADLPLTTVAIDTKVRVEFPVGGDSSDITKFWQYVRSREDADGVSLANLLSTEVISGEPLPAQLPATVNPAKLVIREIIRDNLVILKADQQVRATITNTEFIPRLRELLHPHTMLLFQLSAGGLLDTKVVTSTGPVDPDPEVNVSTNLITLTLPDGTSDNYTLSSVLNFAEISLVN